MKLAVLGASGRTGRRVVEQALRLGHHVRALVRSAEALALKHPSLELVVGDAADAATVARVTEGRDAVVSALGPTTGRTDICSTAARHVIAARAPRYVAISGAGLDVPGDDKDLIGKLVSLMVRTLSPTIFADKVREHELLAASGLRWTLVRPPQLLERPGTGKPRVSLERAPGSRISRDDLAAFVLRAVEDESMIGKAPFVAE